MERRERRQGKRNDEQQIVQHGPQEESAGGQHGVGGTEASRA
jgi:hypothetical protein